MGGQVGRGLSSHDEDVCFEGEEKPLEAPGQRFEIQLKFKTQFCHLLAT